MALPPGSTACALPTSSISARGHRRWYSAKGSTSSSRRPNPTACSSCSCPGAQRYDLIRFWLDAGPAALMRRPKPRAVYLNVGHTGLNEKTLPRWLARHQLRAVYLIHDLIPLTHPEFCRDGEAQKHRRRMVNVLASAAGAICNSKATLDDLWAFAAAEGLPRPPSIAAWISGNPIPFSGQPKTLSKPYFIAVGTIEGRKNSSASARPMAPTGSRTRR